LVEVSDIEPAPRRSVTRNEAVAEKVRRVLLEADGPAAGAKLSG
jgi:hypothetical protein